MVWHASIAAMFARRSNSRYGRLASAIASLANPGDIAARTLAQPRPKGQGNLTKIVSLNHEAAMPATCYLKTPAARGCRDDV